MIMERKIGEIFEFGDEWYQCIGHPYNECTDCDFCFETGKACVRQIVGQCSMSNRSDGLSVAFKKLEKVGEPFSCRNMSLGRYSIIAQWYKVFIDPILTDDSALSWYNSINETILIALNNKEDMEEVNNPNLSNTKKIGKNLKPFDIQKAREGKPVCTRDGR